MKIINFQDLLNSYKSIKHVSNLEGLDELITEQFFDLLIYNRIPFHINYDVDSNEILGFLEKEIIYRIEQLQTKSIFSVNHLLFYQSLNYLGKKQLANDLVYVVVNNPKKYNFVIESSFSGHTRIQYTNL